MLKSCDWDTISADDNGISGDYLNGLALATMKALSNNGISAIWIMIEKYSENELWELIGLYKRACRILLKCDIEAGKRLLSIF